MIEVWHMEGPWQNRIMSMLTHDAERLTNEAKARFAAGDYQHVASIDTSDMEVAWRLTNNVDTSWSMTPDSLVTVRAPLHVHDGETYGLRSSMVGDIMVKDGRMYVVAPVGMLPIP